MIKNKISGWIVWVLIFSGALIGICLFSLSVGSGGIISFREIINLFLKGRGGTEYSIVFDIRLPRIILGFAIGGGLSLAGVILQGLFRNPLVEPYTLGISGGAALGVCLNIILQLKQKVGIITIPLSGFLGALIVIFLVYFLSKRRDKLKIPEMLLTGIMISFISSSLIMLIMALSRLEDLHGIVFWIMGSLEEPNWILINIILLISILCLFISYFFSMDLNAFSLGEEEALHLGVNIEKTKKLLFLLASIVTGFSVSVGGVIGFVGLIVPHIIRIFVGTDHRILLICSFLCGGIFLIFCDTLARTVASPLELPVGVITGILGGSLLIYILTKRKPISLSN
jgi:iron complex transport system permease protein